MNEHPEEQIVRIADGPMVQIEMYQQILREDGIEGKVVGGNLTASLGTVVSGSVELWVHEADAERAAAAIRRVEENRE